MSARGPEEILKAVEDADFDVAIEQVLAMSPEERRREFEANGVDMKALHAEADAFYARLGGDQRAENPTRRPDRKMRFPPRWAGLLAAAIGAAAIGATAVLPALLAKRDEWPFSIDSRTTASRRPCPRDLRERAASECGEDKWQECVDDLTAARKLDPAGDADESVQAMWREAHEALASHPRAAPRHDVK